MQELDDYQYYANDLTHLGPQKKGWCCLQLLLCSCTAAAKYQQKVFLVGGDS
jgi:hypothetical protein